MCAVHLRAHAPAAAAVRTYRKMDIGYFRYCADYPSCGDPGRTRGCGCAAVHGHTRPVARGCGCDAHCSAAAPHRVERQRPLRPSDRPHCSSSGHVPNGGPLTPFPGGWAAALHGRAPRPARRRVPWGGRAPDRATSSDSQSDPFHCARNIYLPVSLASANQLYCSTP